MPSARLTAAALAAALLGGCGGPGPSARAPDGRVEIVLDDFFLEPQRVRTTAGPIVVRVVNRGRLPHNLRLQRRRREPLKITTRLPGARGAARADLPPGRYRMVCTIANHEELGMTGTLVLR